MVYKYGNGQSVGGGTRQLTVGGGVTSCPSSRLSMIPITRTNSTITVSISKDLKQGSREGRKTAPTSHPGSRRSANGHPSSRAYRTSYHRQPSRPEIRPFSEDIYSASSSPSSPCRRQPRAGVEPFRDRSYMSEVYSWARASCKQEETGDLPGLVLTETILSYKATSPRDGVDQVWEEDPLRAGLGYQGYMDCLLRGRKKHINRKPRGITSDLRSKESPTLAPSNSLVQE